MVTQCLISKGFSQDEFWVLKGIVHFEIKIWYLSAYPKGIQDVGVFFSSVDPMAGIGHCLYKREKEHAQRNPN